MQFFGAIKITYTFETSLGISLGKWGWGAQRALLCSETYSKISFLRPGIPSFKPCSLVLPAHTETVCEGIGILILEK